MGKMTVYQYDAFSKIPHKGNPSGVVMQADGLTEEQMQSIALQLGFNETAYALQSDVADLRIRYFTPGHEMNLCGHGTMAIIYALYTNRLFTKREFTIETKAGILPIQVTGTGEDIRIRMQQASPEFLPYLGSVPQLAQSMGLDEQDIDSSMPIMYGSTGIWTLLIPIRTLEAFTRMKPDTPQFPTVLTEMPRASLHPFCFETNDPAAHMHARHFSSPYSGTIEDPVTGTASGVMGAYYSRFIHMGEEPSLTLIVEQGQEIDKDGRVEVFVAGRPDELEINIAGQAVYVREFEVSI